MKTSSTRISDVKREWHVVDAAGKTLGRLSTEVACLLLGKNKPMFSPSLDAGDFVIVVNAAKVRTTGKKTTLKRYYHHSGYPGGMKSSSLGERLEKHPSFVIEHAVRGMLPHTSLGRAMFKKLKVYDGPEHPHAAQLSAKQTTA